MKTAVRKALETLLGPRGFLTGDEVGARYAQDLWGSDRVGDPRFVARPASVDEVSAVLAICHGADQPVVPQGGMTGLVGGGVPGPDELVLSLERMNRILEVDPLTRTATVEAGVTLQSVQDRVAQDGLVFPLDLTSRGSCTIGGCVATNAGGNRVLLYGMTRELVLGIEAVLADGSVIDGLHKLPKNNAGYDLKHLFIGTEGTLGVVTRAVLRLRPAPTTQSVAFCGLGSVADAVTFLRRLEAALPGMLSAFETMWDPAYAVVLALGDRLRVPLTGRHRLYVLAEAQGGDDATDGDRFLAALGACEDVLEEVVVAQTTRDRQAFWAVRERIPTEVLKRQPLFGFDISLPIVELEHYLEVLEVDLREKWPSTELVVFGHLGDGNIHIAVMTGETTRDRKSEVEEIVYRNVQSLHGSISAEHGIGFEKRDYLHFSRTPEEIDVMRLLKSTLDRRGILNRGRVLANDAGGAPATAEIW